MATFQRIDVQGAKERLTQEHVKMVDIRDEHSFDTANVAGSFHLTNESISQFIKETPFTETVLVLCYHGNSSKGVAQYLCDQGYQDVYSVDGGFESWRIQDF
ncbi:thiosulfate sulfurtransferase GlpE [Psychromonas sp. psych-6C06]|uniref:thiosulfate sulfurtransferase GlpE n=1 Tax=Psychromonas sp. psych-6C06 TaxID=2058089 RepID=UPI000C3391E4|nr:thiosulfate sulfurtransferase GlpE [Psychromonas sp. psych-6C06]PKF61264.1 thiosulfate sulfurtransferase GlpE [Psychromonas sp. psych-6C06]